MRTPKPRIPLDLLKGREYWTPGQAARVLGRGAGFWSAAFDRGEVRGYRDGGRRYLLAEGCRGLLAGLGDVGCVVGRLAGGELARKVAAFRARQRALAVG